MSVDFSLGYVLFVTLVYNSLTDVCKQFAVTLVEFKIQEKPGVVLQTYNLSTWEAPAGELPRVQSL